MRKAFLAVLLMGFSSLLVAQQIAKPVVHIYRYKHFETVGVVAFAYCDGILLGRFTSRGNYLDVSIPPGLHTFHSNDKRAGVTINLEAGKDYYFLLSGFDKLGGFGGDSNFRLTMVPPEQGKYEISKLKPLTDKKAVHDIGGPIPAGTSETSPTPQ